MTLPTIGWLCDTLGADAPDLPHDMPLGPISIDTRTIKAGDTFWALRAQRDGHDFVPDALERGAKAIVVDANRKRSSAAQSLRARMIGVRDTTAALTHAAGVWRSRCTYPFIGITGSNGKTSTKDLIVHLLAVRFRVGGTTGNLNNQIGVPLTLLAFPTDLDMAVVEMGASYTGEIGELCEICRPTHGLVTSISSAHLEGFGSIEAVAETKGQLYDYVSDQGFAFVPTDDSLCVIQSSACTAKIGYAFSPAPENWTGGHFAASELKYDRLGRAQFTFDQQSVEIGIPGQAAALTALAALTVARSFDVPFTDCVHAISEHRSARGRLDVIRLNDITVIDDSYNANPASMRAAVHTLSLVHGQRRVAILGDMLELGSFAEREHQRLGEDIASYSVDVAIFVGPLSKLAAEAALQVRAKVHWIENTADFEGGIEDLVKCGDVVLVKASRGMTMERIVDRLKQVFH
ncbi:UDP-N-acetylmuramoyl-tripeptide--D-alanyl-D-alanine ligase [bacterium]|nr:UDP-N-acetylmuramoyl-tripeptide--D-alanyl-D-alanine ligase [bacterium]